MNPVNLATAPPNILHLRWPVADAQRNAGFVLSDRMIDRSPRDDYQILESGQGMRFRSPDFVVLVEPDNKQRHCYAPPRAALALHAVSTQRLLHAVSTQRLKEIIIREEAKLVTLGIG